MNQIIRIDASTAWYPSISTVILWVPASRHQLFNAAQRDCVITATLVLTTHACDQHMLCVTKNRYTSLEAHAANLNNIFDDYEIIDDGWRGCVKISHSDLIMHTLSNS